MHPFKIPFAKLGLSLLFTAGISFGALAQGDGVPSIDTFDKKYLNWYNLSPQQDKVQGTGVNQAYDVLLKGKAPKKKVVVAVIDSGVDVLHEDLKGRLWVNQKEIAGNGLDDDNNGFVDDVHGWGFLGNAAGEDIKYETYEYVRILRNLSPKFANVKSASDVPANQREEYKTYLKVKGMYEKELKTYQQSREGLMAFEQSLNMVEGYLAKYLNRDKITREDVAAISSSNTTVLEAKNWMMERYRLGYTPESFAEMKEHTNMFLDYHLNLDYKGRQLLGDNLEDISDRNYGNSNVTGPRADHGTPVSGIIAGIRNNGLGVDGIAENVEIMALRAVPRGDEYDKDIALAIRYAVDNGANIINMSFGKAFSPQKNLVDDAIKYAEQKGVLMVHSAGNESDNIDLNKHYPNKYLLKGGDVSTWIEVGASSMDLGETLVGDFSNYGQTTVDLFAPGVDIVALAPDNKYSKVDGTSFSSPVVSGVAALVWSYYPELSAQELKDVLLKSASLQGNLKVNLPDRESEKKKKVKFSTLSATGGIVNAYGALEMAEKLLKAKTATN